MYLCPVEIEKENALVVAVVIIEKEDLPELFFILSIIVYVAYCNNVFESRNWIGESVVTVEVRVYSIFYLQSNY